MFDVTTEIPLDNETRTALLLFNERLDARALQQRGKKRVAKAERAKDAAAGAVRNLNNDPDATAEQKAEAEAAYKVAVDEFNVIQANPTAGLDKPKAKTPPADENSDAEAEAPAEPAAEAEAEAEAEAPAEAETPDEPALAEVSADEEEPPPAPVAESE